MQTKGGGNTKPKIKPNHQHTLVLTVVLVELSFRNHKSAKQKIERLRNPQQVQAWERCRLVYRKIPHKKTEKTNQKLKDE